MDTISRKEYTVICISEGFIGTILLGASKLRPERIAKVLNQHGSTGWEVCFQIIESRRMLLFWTREAMIVTFSRSL